MMHAQDALLIQKFLANCENVRYQVTRSERLDRGIDYLEKNAYDIVMLDLGLPDSQELEGRIKVQEKSPDLPVIVLTGNDYDEIATHAVQKGAQDFLVKGQVTGCLMSRSIRYAIERKKLLTQLADTLRELKALQGLLHICMHCKKIRDDKGERVKMESYISTHSKAEFSHGLCSGCAVKMYPKYMNKPKEQPGMYPAAPVRASDIEDIQLTTRQKSRIIDLTKPLNETIGIYSSGHYSDPRFECIEWASIASHGFRVLRLSLGTQTGTHIDAPAHFLENAPTLDTLSPDNLIGKYLLIDLPRKVEAAEIRTSLKRLSDQNIIFLRTPENGVSMISREGLDILLSLPINVFILSGEIEVTNAEPLEFHRIIARAGKFLVEDLDQKTAQAVPQEGEILALPLRLIGTSGSPCRVIVRI